MTFADELLLQLVFISIGVWFAKRWVVQPPAAIAWYPRGLSIGTLVAASWIGTFVFATLSIKIGSLLSGGVAYDEGAELPYEVMHHGVGSNVVNLFFGWSSGLIFWWIAGLIRGGQAMHGCGDQSAAAEDLASDENTNTNP